MEKFRVYGLRTSDESQRERDHRSLARKVASEGIVLLKNDGILPIQEKKVALYGAGARMTVRGGTGSGDTHERYSISIEQGLLNAGYEILNKKWMDRFDLDYAKKKEVWRNEIEDKIKDYTMENVLEMFEVINSIPLRFPIGDKIKQEELSDEANTAIYVVARQAGEGHDRKVEEGDFLLDEVEKYNIKFLAKNYRKLLLVINCGGMIDLSDIDDIENIGAILFCGQCGTEGGNAFADIVSGKVTPSGKLADTWAMKYEDYPSSDTYSYLNGDLENEDYKEGIYVGYRYFDSFEKTPRYPFGYGLSYTNFNYEYNKIDVQNSVVNIYVKVMNSGKCYSGKEVIQAYIEKPHGRLDHEKRSLAAFSKTKELEVGEYEEITLSFDIREVASYDANKAEWFLERGEYGVYIGNSSRDNELVAVLVIDEEVITEKTENICPLQRSFEELKAKSREVNYSEDVERFIIDKKAISCNIHVYEKPAMKVSSKVGDILSRLTIEDLAKLCVGGGQFGKTFNVTPGAVGWTTMELIEKGIPNVNFSDGPAGLNLTTEAVVEEDGTVKYLNSLPESQKWGFIRKIEAESLGNPEKGTTVYQYMTAWPATHVQAQTWNIELTRNVGQAVGLEMIETGITLWLAPALNIHRNPLCGRNFEYYSEDPLLSGKMASSVAMGVQSYNGIGVTMKHFCCNNQEDNRNRVSENVSERALRELYLRGFRYVIEEAKPKAIMSSYNKVNGQYVINNPELLIKVLRNEWSYEGLVMSDWHSTGEGKASHEKAPISGNDLIMPGNNSIVVVLLKAVEEGRILKEDLELCASHVLNLIFESAVV